MEVKIGDVFVAVDTEAYPVDYKIEGYGRVIVIESLASSGNCYWVRNLETNKRTTFSTIWLANGEWIRYSPFKTKLEKLLCN